MPTWRTQGFHQRIRAVSLLILDAVKMKLVQPRYDVHLPGREGRVSCREIYAWLYRGHRPNAVARAINQATARVYALGIAPNYLVALELPGRRSGRTISFPLVMAVVNGERYLVAMLGTEAGWVRNLRAAGNRALLRHGRVERVRLEEVEVEKRAPVLKAYLKRAPGARPHIPVKKDASLVEFEAIAAQIPVFRVAVAG